MPIAIPYNHPSLVLGSVVDTRVLDLLSEIRKEQETIDGAKEKLNSFVMMKRSLAMTVNELIDMSVDVADIKNKINELDGSISQAAMDYMTVRIKGEEEIQQLKEKFGELPDALNPQSPIDFTKSKLEYPPLSSNSLKFDSQYFSFGSNLEDDQLAVMEKYIKESTSELGSQSNELAKSASSQIKNQHKNHNLAGTLIITACCTHRLVELFDPLVLDEDKIVEVWNTLHPSNVIDVSDPRKVQQFEKKGEGTADGTITLITGASFGSSFVGMVHMLQSDEVVSGNVDDMVKQMKEKLKLGGWIENSVGGVGVESSFLEEVKKNLSTQKISAHVSLLCLGAVPSIASGELKLGLDKVMQPEASKISDILDPAEAPKITTLNSGADEAVALNRRLAIQQGRWQSVMQTLGKIDHGSNKVLDINSLMSAFGNYVQSIHEAKTCFGVPVNFYLKKLSGATIARLWLDKYYPSQKKKKQGSKAEEGG